MSTYFGGEHFWGGSGSELLNAALEVAPNNPQGVDMSLEQHLADPKLRSYVNNIQAKTGKTPDDFIRLAQKKGFPAPEVKAGQIVAWLNEEFGLGRGHAMAVVVVLRTASAK